MAGKWDKNREALKKDLREHTRTREELMELLGFSLSSLNKHIREIKDELAELGTEVLIQRRGVGYHIQPVESSTDQAEERPNVSSSTITFERSLQNHVRKIVVIMILQKEGRPMTLHEIASVYSKLSIDPISANNKQALFSQIQNMLESDSEQNLVSRGLVQAEIKNGTIYYSLTKQAPVYLALRKETAQSLHDLIQIAGDSHPLYSVLKRIDNKLLLASANATDDWDAVPPTLPDLDQPNDPKRLIIRLREQKNPTIATNMERLNRIPLDTHAVKVTYQSDETSQAFIFFTGLYFYSSEKDKLYLIGRKAESSEDTILNVEKINDITVCEDRNDLYQNGYFKRLFDEMFAVSVEPPMHVVVAFDNFGSIPEKVRALESVRNRKRFNIQPPSRLVREASDGKIIYEDDIRGMEDFAKYLRKFGSGVTVIQPESLKKRMETTVLRMKQNYGI